ncbi:uncharacterized protein LOC134227430 [Armigeres subalbatus]|uniref:uncharacterized protein LOC134227430 n=1 Tax=Armigeres subalbatus TaxID=124917 RepID=UPI002ED0E0BA
MSQIVTRNKYNEKAGTSASRGGVLPKGARIQKPNQKRNATPQQISSGQVSETWHSDTVYIETTDPEQNRYNHPAEIGKTLNGKGIGRIKDIQRIGKFRFKILFETAKEASPLILCKLEDVGLKIYTPRITTEIIGLAKEVPLCYSTTEIFENLEVDKEVISIERLKRKDSEGNLIDTRTVRIKFKGRVLPETAVLYGWRFQLELYIFPVKQCRNCWMFGHKKEMCRKKTKCPKCGTEHGKEEQCRGQTTCLNCREEHPADDRRCPERERQSKVNEAMQRRRITQKEALELYPKSNIRLENQFEILGRYDEFPQLQQQEEYGTNSNNRPRRNKPHRATANSYQQHWRQRRNSEAGSDLGTVNDADPGIKVELAKLERKFEELAQKITIIGKIIKLQQCVKEEFKKQQDLPSLEALVIKISTVLNEIIDEFGNEITNIRNHTENESNTYEENGE